MSDESQSSVNIARNKILQEMGELSFQDALSDVNERLIMEKKKHTRLALLSAKSWILRNKLHSALHDPYIYSISEVENTDIFDGLDDEEYNEYDSLFDDGEDVKNIEVTILKETTVDDQKLVKDTIVSLPEPAAKKLIKEGNAKKAD